MVGEGDGLEAVVFFSHKRVSEVLWALLIKVLQFAVD